MQEIITTERPLLRVEIDIRGSEDFGIQIDQRRGADFFLKNGLWPSELKTLTLQISDQYVVRPGQHFGKYRDNNRYIMLNDLRGLAAEQDAGKANINDEFLRAACLALDDILPGNFRESFGRGLSTSITAAGAGVLGYATASAISGQMEYAGMTAGAGQVVVGSLLYYFLKDNRFNNLLKEANKPEWGNIITIDSSTFANS